MFTSSLVRDANVCVFVIRDSEKKKHNRSQHFWVTVVVVLQNERTVLTLSPFLMGEFLLL